MPPCRMKIRIQRDNKMHITFEDKVVNILSEYAKGKCKPAGYSQMQMVFYAICIPFYIFLFQSVRRFDKDAVLSWGKPKFHKNQLVYKSGRWTWNIPANPQIWTNHTEVSRAEIIIPVRVLRCDPFLFTVPCTARRVLHS